MIVRPLLQGDARAALEARRAAVRHSAARDYYSADILEQWAPPPITDEAITKFLENPDGEVRFVAELDGKIVGLAAIAPLNCELQACYVAPEAGGKGVGTALLLALETEARKRGLPFLKMDASLNAESFYKARGYEVRSRGEHLLRSGQRMACVHMQKNLPSNT